MATNPFPRVRIHLQERGDHLCQWPHSVLASQHCHTGDPISAMVMTHRNLTCHLLAPRCRLPGSRIRSGGAKTNRLSSRRRRHPKQCLHYHTNHPPQQLAFYFLSKHSSCSIFFSQSCFISVYNIQPNCIIIVTSVMGENIFGNRDP